MSWLGRFFRPAGGSDDLVLLKLRATRFRQLLRSYGAFQALIEDAAEKQGGGFILDRQYVVSLAEQVAELADSVAFDLNVLTSQQDLPFYDQVGRLRGDLRSLLSNEGTDARTNRGPEPEAAVSPARLAAALARAPVVYRGRGQVASRGVAAGPVCHSGEGPLPEALPAGSVLVAEDLPPGQGAFEAMGRVAALLLDRGGVAGAAARRARELRIPAIVGLGDATLRLSEGSEVTVDADENVVYEGRIGELLDYDLSTRAASDEEPEYALLRTVRRAAFSLTLPADRAASTAPDCGTIRDLVHLAQYLAGNAIAELVASRCHDAGEDIRLDGAPWCRARVIRLDASPARRGGDGAPSDEPPSRPLGALLEGLVSSERASGGLSDRHPCRVEAVATEEHALAVLRHREGLDLLDATASGAAELNSAYCRFSPGGGADTVGTRGALAASLLARLGFAVARTGHDVTGWIHGLSGPEIEERVRAVARLHTRLSGRGAAEGESLAAGAAADSIAETVS